MNQNDTEESAIEQCGLCAGEPDYEIEVEEVETGETVTRALCERHWTSLTAWWMSMAPAENPSAQEAVEEALAEVSALDE